MTPVLIVSGGGFQGLGLLEAAQRLPGVRPHIADVHAQSVTRYLCADFHVLPPLADEVTYIDALERLIAEQAITAVLPATAYELPLLARLREPLAQRGVVVAVCATPLLDILLDKRKTATYLSDHGLPIQPGVDPHTHDFTTPLFGRPLAGWGGRGTRLLRTTQERDVAGAADELDQCLWTAYLERFEEFSADFAIDAAGTVSPIVLRRRLRTSGGFAVISGSSFDPDLLQLSRRTAVALASDGGDGFFNVQLLRADADASAVVSDINPRFGTSSGHGLGEGVNLLAHVLGLDSNPSPATRRPVLTVRRLADIHVPRLQSRPAGVVFDLDDCLIDHKLWFARKASAAWRAVARDWCDRDAFELEAFGLIDEGERRRFIDLLCQRLGWDDARHQELLETFRQARVDTPVHADVAACLASLRQAGLRIGLLTDNPPATQRQKLDGAGAALGHFDAVVFARETGAEKPAASGFLAVAEALGLPPTQLCMVGDNLFRDALGALRAGYGAAILLQRAGGFVQAHPGLAGSLSATADHRLARAPDLVIAREIILGE